MPENRLLTNKEVAEILRIAPNTLVRWRSEGIGPPFLTIEGSIRYNALSLDEWIANQKALK